MNKVVYRGYIASNKLQSMHDDAIEKLGVDIIIVENALTIPMNIPLGLALVETVMETGLSCIAHHHDFGAAVVELGARARHEEPAKCVGLSGNQEKQGSPAMS